MMPVPTYLRNHQAVLDAFGYWPHFHDAPVLAFRYSEGSGGRVELDVHGWQMTDVVDDRGYFKLTRHHLVRLAFEGIGDADLQKFAADTILSDLAFSAVSDFETAGMFKVTLESARGSDCSGSFSAQTGEVLEVKACDEWLGRGRL